MLSVRYGLLGDSAGLHAIWHGSDTTLTAGGRLAIVAAFALLSTALATRVFSRAALR